MTDTVKKDIQDLKEKKQQLYNENNQQSKSQQLLKDKGYVYRHNYVFLCLLFIGLVILATSLFFVDIEIIHPFIMIFLLVVTCISFSLLGFILGIWANNFEQLQLVPLLIITPLVFLGGSFYSISMLPKFWQVVSLFNPVVYLISGFRWAFYNNSDVSIAASLFAITIFTVFCIFIIFLIFKTGWRLRP